MSFVVSKGAKASAFNTSLTSPVLCASVIKSFPQSIGPVHSKAHDLFHYNSATNGPHEHSSHASKGPIAHLLCSAPRGQRGSKTDLLCFPRINPFGIQQRRFASKFTVTDSRDTVFTSPDFTPVERPGDSPDANRAFSYFMVGATGVLGAMGAKSTVMDFLASWSASSEALAMAQVEIDLGAIPEGKSVVMKWRGKPIFIRHRTSAEVEEANSVNIADLRDPQLDSERTQRPEWIVMLGICTHLGCVPLANSGDYNGWYCPCQ